MKCLRRVVGVAIAISAVGPADGQAQTGAPGQISIVAEVGGGSGPASVVSGGLGLTGRIGRHLRLELVASRMAQGRLDFCEDTAPSICSGDIFLLLGGVGLVGNLSSNLNAFAQGKAGLFSLSGIDELPGIPVGEGERVAIGGDAGFLVSVSEQVALRAGVRYLKAFDDDEYRAAFGEDLDYVMFIIGFEWAVTSLNDE